MSGEPTKRRPISPVMGEYLAEVYRLASSQPESDWVTTSALADKMNVSQPAVARMASRLKRRGLLDHEPYRGMSLTAAGWREAMVSLRRHRLSEVFPGADHGLRLARGPRRGGYDSAGADAARGGAHERDGRRAAPLPAWGADPSSADGLMPVVHDEVLTAINPPAALALSRVKTADPDRLLYLQSLGLTPGQPFRLVNRAPFNGPVRLEIGRQEVVIGMELAGVLHVCQPDQFKLQLRRGRHPNAFDLNFLLQLKPTRSPG